MRKEKLFSELRRVVRAYISILAPGRTFVILSLALMMSWSQWNLMNHPLPSSRHLATLSLILIKNGHQPPLWVKSPELLLSNLFHLGLRAQAPSPIHPGQAAEPGPGSPQFTN